MPSNDTQNIYSSEYGGEGAPIPASKISYDNTASGLTADDVQEAIDEVAGDVANLTAEDVAYDNTTSGLVAENVQGAIDEVATVLDGKYLLKGVETVSATGNATKTHADILAEVATAFNTRLSTLADDEIAMILCTSGAHNLIPLTPANIYSKNTAFTRSDFLTVGFSDAYATQVLVNARMNTSAESSYWLVSLLGSASQTFASPRTSSIFGDGSTLTLNFAVYKKV